MDVTKPLRDMLSKLEAENKRMTYELDMGSKDLAKIRQQSEEITRLRTIIHQAIAQVNGFSHQYRTTNFDALIELLETA